MCGDKFADGTLGELKAPGAASGQQEEGEDGSHEAEQSVEPESARGTSVAEGTPIKIDPAEEEQPRSAEPHVTVSQHTPAPANPDTSVTADPMDVDGQGNAPAAGVDLHVGVTGSGPVVPRGPDTTLKEELEQS